jgi:hypothetical protein
MTRRLAPPIALLCAAALATALATACGKPANDSAAAKANASAEAAEVANGQLDFAKCMRERGQNMPDPDPATRELIFPTNSSHERGSAWDLALHACQHFLPGGAVNPGGDAQELEQWRAFAVCMRAHDIGMSDPETTGANVGRMVIHGRLENVPKTELQNDPGYRAAMQACKDTLPGSANGGAA